VTPLLHETTGTWSGSPLFRRIVGGTYDVPATRREGVSRSKYPRAMRASAVLVLIALLLTACEGEPAPSGSVPVIATATAMVTQSDETGRSPSPIAGLYGEVLNEATSAPPLELPIDDRLVTLTHDDFLSGLRPGSGPEIVGGGPLARFWFVVGSTPDVATAAWVELDRHRQFMETIYTYPTEPMADLIEIVDPNMSATDVAALHEQLGIDEARALHPAGSDITVVSGGIRYHLVADTETIYLVATRSVD
jgi:hypothetical protein